jgi:hypothetical protein
MNIVRRNPCRPLTQVGRVAPSAPSAEFRLILRFWFNALNLCGSPSSEGDDSHHFREFFADSKIERETYEQHIGQMPGNDPDDHHHMAAAIAGDAAALVTENIKDFPIEPLAALGLRVVRPDAYLSELLNNFPNEAISTIVRVAPEKRNPPRSAAEILDALNAAGLPTFTAQARKMLPSQG